MVTPTFAYLDTLPLTDKLLSPQSSAEANVESKGELNLAFNINNAHTRLAELISLTNQEESVASINNLNTCIESYLAILLTVPTFANLEKTNLTSHYCKRNKLLNYSGKIMPSSEYIKDLLFTGQKNWGTVYGSLGYFINLKKEFQEYATPSQLVSQALEQLILNSKNIQLANLLGAFGTSQEALPTENLYNLMSQLENSIASSTPKSDVDIYSIGYLTSDIANVYKYLLFLEHYLPKVIQWYFSFYVEDDVPESPPVANLDSLVDNSRDIQAYYILRNIAEKVANYGMGSESFTNLAYNFMHQKVSSSLIFLVEDIIKLRQSQIVQEFKLPRELTNVKPLVKLVKEFIGNNNLNTTYKLDLLCKTLLLSLTPPSGYNLLLVAISATLLNRAYILLHKSNFPSNELSLSLENMSLFEPNSVEILLRFQKLLFLGGHTLRKSNLKHLQIIGDNIVKLTQLDVSANNLDLLDLGLV